MTQDTRARFSVWPSLGWAALAVFLYAFWLLLSYVCLLAGFFYPAAPFLFLAFGLADALHDSQSESIIMLFVIPTLLFLLTLWISWHRRQRKQHLANGSD